MVSREEFTAIMAFVSAGCGKPLCAASAEVYYSMLGDLPIAALQAAAQQSLLEHSYATFPPIALVRRLATAALCGEAAKLTSFEAWGLVMTAVSRFGHARQAMAIASLPALVAMTAKAIGWRALCDATDTDTIRAHFLHAFDAIAGRERRDKLLPAPLRELLAAIGKPVEYLEYDERNAWQVFQDANGKRLVGKTSLNRSEDSQRS